MLFLKYKTKNVSFVKLDFYVRCWGIEPKGENHFSINPISPSATHPPTNSHCIPPGNTPLVPDTVSAAAAICCTLICRILIFRTNSTPLPPSHTLSLLQAIGATYLRCCYLRNRNSGSAPLLVRSYRPSRLLPLIF